jgi:hypothetical protein
VLRSGISLALLSPNFRKGNVMHLLAIHDRGSLEDASSLIAKFGDEAVIEAATIADGFRDSGNLDEFCRWRQIERAVMLLQLEDVVGEVH